MKRDFKLFVADILDAMEAIKEFVKGKDLKGLLEDEKTLSAVLWKLTLIGEAAKHIPQDLRKRWPEIPWKEMAGMRDRIVHAYFGIDRQLLWETITVHIPRIKPALRAMLENL